MIKNTLKTALLLLTLYIFTFENVWAQADSGKIKVTYASSDDFFKNQDSMISIDSCIDFFHQYEKEFQFSDFFRNNGSVSSPMTHLFFEEDNRIIFNTGISIFDRLLSQAGATRIYDTYTPFFNFNYLQGNLEMQKFEALHSRNITPFVNATVDYISTRNDGFYERQFSKIQDLNLNASFHSPKGFYRALLVYQFQKAIHFENGGITNDTLFRKYSARDRQGADVYLSEAEANRKKHILTLRHSLDLGIVKRDSVEKPSTTQVRLNHEFSFANDYYSYNDESPNPDYYNFFHLDSAVTLDSLQMTKFSNRVFLSYDKKESFSVKAGFLIEDGKVVQNSKDYLFQNTILELSGVKKFRSSELTISGHYIINGTYSGMYNLLGKAVLHPSPNVNMILLAQSSRRQIPLIQNAILSNHLQWERQLQPRSWSALSASILWKDFRTQFSIKYSQHKNYVYFDRNIEPNQITSSFGIWQISLFTHAIAGRFHFQEHLAYQYNPYASELGLPALLFNSTNYYENTVFKGHLKIQAGFDLRVTDGFYPQAYFAPFGIYYRQNDFYQDMYPVVDVFINAAVKTVRVFVKYEHINEGFPATVYYLRPYYPNDPRTIRFGLDWMFFN